MEKPSRAPVATASELDGLDKAQISAGHRAGVENRPCGSERSRAYWHGWKSGRCEAGYAVADADARRLARDVAQRERIEHAFTRGRMP